jgi:predicted DNA-binding transcriptional regulator AlpA
MDGQPVSFDDVSKVEHGRSHMSNRNMNQSGVPASPLAMRAKAPVFSAEDQLRENRIASHSEQSIYPTYPTTFKAYVPTAERTLHSIESAGPSHSIPMPKNDRLMNARQVAAKLGVSERWVRDHTTRRSPRIRGLKMGSLMRYRLADVEAFLAELDTQPSSRPSRFRV